MPTTDPLMTALRHRFATPQAVVRTLGDRQPMVISEEAVRLASIRTCWGYGDGPSRRTIVWTP
jgi:hypothetical protein